MSPGSAATCFCAAIHRRLSRLPPNHACLVTTADSTESTKLSRSKPGFVVMGGKMRKSANSPVPVPAARPGNAVLPGYETMISPVSQGNPAQSL